ncbi:MAG: ABC transporter substrate-binding protein [Actinobacteria bacterium]|nr:ABC transporter substrate-binding protein [Actinomycetota bacterium]NBY14962.1 ABC transporter substrate-binding protein [Actinomycetota bacterium]
MLAVIALVTAISLTGCSNKTSAGGTITFGVDATYAPNEFKDDNGKPIGWEVELGDAIAKKLGKTAVFKIAGFDTIIPGVTGGKYDAGLSSFSDTPERQKQVDFVNYYSAGLQWASAKGKTVDPENACGLTVAVQNATTAVDDVKARSKACTDAGKAAIQSLGFDDQAMATQAAASGRADAMSADSPITQYAVKQNADKLDLIGNPFDVVLYGIPVKKGNTELANSLKDALTQLQDDGTYTKILDKWGVTAGAVDSITINGK